MFDYSYDSYLLFYKKLFSYCQLFHLLVGRKECRRTDTMLFALIFFLYMGISHVPSTVLLIAFLSDSSSSEKSGLQIIPLSLYFF